MIDKGIKEISIYGMETNIHGRAKKGTLVEETVKLLTQISLESEVGAYLGTEDDLLPRLQVSRPTLRQAAKLLANDKLISVRRGIKGGFYADRPNAADSIKALAQYLRLNGATISDVLAVTKLTAEEAGALAAANNDPDLRARLVAFQAAIDDNETSAEMVRSEGYLVRLLAEMSGNPALQVVMEIGYSFGMDEHGVRFYATEKDRERARVLQRALCDAILAGDTDIARLMMRRRSAMIESWLENETE